MEIVTCVVMYLPGAAVEKLLAYNSYLEIFHLPVVTCIKGAMLENLAFSIYNLEGRMSYLGIWGSNVEFKF